MKQKFVFHVLIFLSLVLVSCNKKGGESPVENGRVRISLFEADGKPLSDAAVGVYDEAGAEQLKKDPLTEAVETVKANSEGVADYVMTADRWFSTKLQRTVTFAVRRTVDGNVKIWSEQKSVKSGESVSVTIKLTSDGGSTGDGDGDGDGSGDGDGDGDGNPETVDLERIEIVSAPAKTTYFMGEPLVTDGLVVKGYYSDGTDRVVDIAAGDISGFSSETPTHELVVTVTKETKQASFTVEILPMRLTGGVLTEVSDVYGEITLPADVREIADKVFVGKQITKVTLNEGLQKIGEGAFAASAVRKIVLPSTVTTIDEYAFSYCNNLELVDMSRSSMTALPSGLFAYSTVKEIIFPANVETIGAQAFMNAKAPVSLTIPETVKRIEREAFRECNIVNVELPNSIEYVADRAFYLSVSLESVISYGAIGGDASSSVGSYCFTGCSSLKSLTIPESIRSLGQSLTGGCTSLETITIGSNVENMGFGVFNNCAVKNVYVKAQTPPVAQINIVWYGFPQTVVAIYVPHGCADAYKGTVGWSEFTDKIFETASL